MYREGRSVDIALREVTGRILKAMENRSMVLGAILDIEGAFNFATGENIFRDAERHGIPNTLIRWIHNSRVELWKYNGAWRQKMEGRRRGARKVMFFPRRSVLWWSMSFW